MNYKDKVKFLYVFKGRVNRKYVCLFMKLFFINIAFAQQSNLMITGTINGVGNKPVDGGNSIALSPKDSSIIKGDFFMEGKLNFKGPSEPIFLLKITSLGYKDSLIPIIRTERDSILDLGVLTLISNNTLKEIEVTAKTVFFESDGEKVKVNVENTSLNASGNALDVLRRSPGVLVSNTDNVTVFGRGAALIYVDGQLISSIDILKSIPSSDIKTIEIINNPSAKYDAAGRAIINIITKKNSLKGYNGSLIQNFLQGKYLFSYSGLRFNYKGNKWSFNAGYGLVQGQVWSSDSYHRDFKTNDTSSVAMNNYIYEKRKNSNVHNYRSSLSYAVDSVSRVDIQYTGYYSGINSVTDNSNIISQDGVASFALQTKTNGKPTLINNSINVIYNRKLDTLGSELFAAIQYGKFTSSSVGQIFQIVSAPNYYQESQKRNNNKNDIQLLTAQLDYTKLFSKKWKVEAGLKDALTLKSSTVKFENFTSQGDWISDPNYYNGFEYKENIMAGYANVAYKKKKFNFRAGVRGEVTTSDGFSSVQNKKVIDRQYLNIFPSAFIGYNFNKDLTLGGTYSSRIVRPTYQDMDPFINYIDSLSSFRGNPYLLPEYTNSFEGSLIYMKEASLTFGYSRTNGAMKLVVDKLNNGTDAFIATTKNINYGESYSLGITIPYEFSWWTTSNYFGYFYNSFSYKDGGTVVQNTKPSYYIYLYDEFRLKKIVSLEITYEYSSSGVDGIFITKPFSKLTATVKKTFLKDKLVCRFMANDILSSYIMSGQSYVQGYSVSYSSRINSHFFLLSLTYKFGKLKGAEYKDKAVNKEEFGRIKNGRVN
jgi:outer membrane receptor protein involved in Fe transport